MPLIIISIVFPKFSIVRFPVNVIFDKALIILDGLLRSIPSRFIVRLVSSAFNVRLSNFIPYLSNTVAYISR